MNKLYYSTFFSEITEKDKLIPFFILEDNYLKFRDKFKNFKDYEKFIFDNIKEYKDVNVEKIDYGEKETYITFPNKNLANKFIKKLNNLLNL